MTTQSQCSITQYVSVLPCCLLPGCMASGPSASLSPHLLILSQPPAVPAQCHAHHFMDISYLLGVHTVGLLHQPVEHVLVGLLLLQLARGELLAQGAVVRHAGKAEDVGIMHYGLLVLDSLIYLWMS